MRIIVTASREFDRRDLVEDRLNLVLLGAPMLTLIHGHAHAGGDKFAHEWGQVRRPQVLVAPRPADWPTCNPDDTRPGLTCPTEGGHRRQNGRGDWFCPLAGYRRNQDMVDSGADRIEVFWRDGSRGTRDCLDRAIAADIEPFITAYPGWQVPAVYRRFVVDDSTLALFDCEWDAGHRARGVADVELPGGPT